MREVPDRYPDSRSLNFLIPVVTFLLISFSFSCSFFFITKKNVHVFHSLSTAAEDSEDNELGMPDDSGWNDATAYPGS